MTQFELKLFFSKILELFRLPSQDAARILFPPTKNCFLADACGATVVRMINLAQITHLANNYFKNRLLKCHIHEAGIVNLS